MPSKVEDFRLTERDQGKYIGHIIDEDSKVREVKFTDVQYHGAFLPGNSDFVLLDKGQEVIKLKAKNLSFRIRNILQNLCR